MKSSIICHSNTKSEYRLFYCIIVVIEILLLVCAVGMVRDNNINRLNAKQIINVAFDILAMLILMVVTVSCIVGRKNNSSYSFVLLLTSVYVCLFFELGAWVVDGIAYKRVANYVFNIGCNSMMLICTAMFFFFTCKSLDIDNHINNYKCMSVIAATVVGILLELFNIKYGFYYYIDRYGVYARNQIGSIGGYFPFVYILGCTGYHILNKKTSVKTKLMYMMYFLIPFGVSGWYMLTGLPPTFFVGTFIAVLLIYVNIYIEYGSEATKYELESAHKEAELAMQKNRQILSQIRPHFIFNALGSIEELCVVDSKKAESAVHYFAKYLRANMDALGDQDLISFKDELEHIHNYIWLEKMRFEDELDYDEKIEVIDFLVPPLSIQPLIENAVKHGMRGKAEGVLHVVLHTVTTANGIEISIADDGCGFDAGHVKDDGKSHIGMKYTRSSIENRLGGNMSIDSNINEGTKITLCIPRVIDDNYSSR